MNTLAPPRAPGSITTTINPEAWGIAYDLIEDLGAEDAIAWADEYMVDLEQRRSGAVARWKQVTDALSELASATLH